MSKTKVEKILGMSPTSEQMDEYYKSDGSGIVALGSEIASINCEYRCETDVIHVTFRSSTKKVVSKSFN